MPDLDTVNVDGIEIELVQEKFVSANIIRAGAGTTGYKGGDAGYGGRTIFTLKDESSTDLRCEINGHMIDDVTEVKIIVGGDAELTTLIQSLKFIVQTLERESKREAG